MLHNELWECKRHGFGNTTVEYDGGVFQHEFDTEFDSVQLRGEQIQ